MTRPGAGVSQVELRTLRFLGEDYPFETGDSVLDCLSANGLNVASSCQAGSCGACVLRAIGGVVATAAQSSLHSGARVAGEFLSCVCPASADLHVQPVDTVQSVRGVLESVEEVDEELIRVRVRVERPLAHRPGQVIHLVRPSDGAGRPFAIASAPEDPFLEVYAQQWPGGEFSPWLLGSQGKEVVVRGPLGHFFYMNDPDEPLVLLGSGVAAAPVLGVLRTAIRAGHRAPIFFLRLGTSTNHHFRVRVEREADRAACPVSWSEELCDSADARTAEKVLRSVPPSLNRTRVYLAGPSLLLRKLRLRVFGRGADADRVHIFPFKRYSATQAQRFGERSTDVASAP